MNIAITGHTKGIGEYIFKNVKSTGFSRSNGYDITDVDVLIESILHFDVFINNTFHPVYQQKLFEKLFEKWKYENKIIINILNLSTLYNDDILTKHEYFESKKLFKQSIQNILQKHKNKKVKIVNLFIGTMENHDNYANKNKLNYIDVINTIHFVLNSPHHVEHAFISIGRTTEYESKIF
jgi:hypothetical protein